MVTVVVLPLVPVSVSHGAAPCARRIRHASSTSPQIGIPAPAAAASIGWSGRQPGEVTTTSAAAPATCGRPSATPSPSWTSASSTAKTAARSDADRSVELAPPTTTPGATLEQGVRGREPADPDTCHDDPEPRPVGVGMGQLAEPAEPCRRPHWALTTHSA